MIVMASEKDLLDEVLKQRRWLISTLRAAEGTKNYGISSQCREMIATIEHNPDILAAMKELGVDWDWSPEP